MPNPNQPNNPNDNKPPQGGPPPLRFNRNLFGWLMIVALGVVVVVLISQAQNSAKPVTWGELVNHVKSGHVDPDKGIIIKEDRIVANLSADVPNVPPSGRVMVKLPPGAAGAPMVDRLLDQAPNDIRVERSSGLLIVILQLLPWLLIFGVIWFFLFRAVRSGGGGMGMLGSFGRSRHKLVNKEMTNVTLDDVAGIEEAKDEVQEIIEFLKHPKKFQRLGGRMPRGVLLIGQPGCGKTLLAKAIAGEAEVPFFSISGSDFVEMFVGVGASRVRDLFKQAKDNSPCIIFLDEIDAVGPPRRRVSPVAGTTSASRRSTPSSSRWTGSKPTIRSSSSPRPTGGRARPGADPPGRFDRQITVPLPDVKGRYEILKVHAKRESR
jgi:cell division protease FtsH